MSDSEVSDEEVLLEEDDDPDISTGEDAFAAQAYSYALEGASEFTNDAILLTHSTHWFPYLEIDAIVFPEQHSPHILRKPEHFFRVWESANGNGFVVCISKSVQERKPMPFVATVCKVLRAHQQTFGVELIGSHRCNVLEINRENGEAKVEILPEVEHAEVLPRMLPKYARSSSPYSQRELASRITGYPVNLTRDITLRNVEKIVTSLSSFLPDEKVQEALDLGLTNFSYYVARNMFANHEIEYTILKENSVDTRIALAVEYCQSLWGLCTKCDAQLFSQSSIISPNDSNMAHVNEYGYVHKVTLVSELENFDRVTRPSMMFTWFPTYSWTILQCSQCENHIGWEYLSDSRRPHRFFGVRREGIKFTLIERSDDDEVIIKSEDNES